MIFTTIVLCISASVLNFSKNSKRRMLAFLLLLFSVASVSYSMGLDYLTYSIWILLLPIVMIHRYFDQAISFEINGEKKKNNVTAWQGILIGSFCLAIGVSIFLMQLFVFNSFSAKQALQELEMQNLGSILMNEKGFLLESLVLVIVVNIICMSFILRKARYDHRE